MLKMLTDRKRGTVAASEASKHKIYKKSKMIFVPLIAVAILCVTPNVGFAA